MVVRWGSVLCSLRPHRAVVIPDLRPPGRVRARGGVHPCLSLVCAEEERERERERDARGGKRLAEVA